MTVKPLGKSSGKTLGKSNDTLVTAAVLVIGDEILSGRTQDKNVAVIAQKLGDIGIQLKEVRVVPDEEKEIIIGVNALRNKYDYLMTTGGIGPTHDDITTVCVAKAMMLKVVRNDEAVERLKAHYSGSTQALNEARLKMADIPVGAEMIENPVSGAPGWRYENVFVLAGVPRIMEAMLDFVTPQLEGGAKKHSATVSTLQGEGDIAGLLKKALAAYEGIEIGSYPYFKDGKFGVSVVIRGFDEATVVAAQKSLEEALKVEF